jgi:hypothetical protein
MQGVKKITQQKKEVENNPQWGKKCKTCPCNWKYIVIQHLKIYLSTSQKMTNVIM